MLLEDFLSHPGFLYQIGSSYYYLGKWICSPCKDQDAQDCHFMFHMNLDSKEDAEAMYYFQKIRAMCEFALKVPYNPVKIRSDMECLLGGLSAVELSSLSQQFKKFQFLLGSCESETC